MHTRAYGNAHPTPKLIESALVILAATLFFLYVFGWQILDPKATAWMLSGDPAQHYLGWQFFRSETWQWPPGRIVGLGIPDGTALAFTDAIPLLALLLKPFSSWLPNAFQYFGAWILICYALIGYFGLRLLSTLTDRTWLRLMGAGFFILSPPLLFRGHGHESLMAHWLLIAGIDTYLRGWSWPRWLTWSAIAALSHPYLLLMVLGLLTASAISALLVKHNKTLVRLLCESTGIFAVLLGLLWSTGSFSGQGGLAAEGYGYFSMNILSLFDPIFSASRFLTQNTFSEDFNPFGQYEGFLYLGAGMIVLAAVAFALQLSAVEPTLKPLLKKYWPLIVVVTLFWIFALSNKVMLGNIHLVTFPLPQFLIKILSIFRASGRLGWPLFYLLNFVIIAILIRKLPYRAALVVIGAGLLLQFTDQSKKYHELNGLMSQRMAWQTPLKDQQWAQLASAAKRLIVMPPHAPMEKIYIPFANLAALHHLATNAAHLARTSSASTETYIEGEANRLADGHYDPKTLYVFPEIDGLKYVPLNYRSKVIELDGRFVLPAGL